MIEAADQPFAGTVVALTDGPNSPAFVTRDCIMQDDLKGIDLGVALAHEAGHALGDPDNPEAGNLINAKAPGRTIPADAAIRMNNNAGAL